LKRVRGEFLTEKEANSALDKINSYCQNAKIIYNYTNPDYFDYDNYIPDDRSYYISEPGIFNSGNFGNFGILNNWNINPHFSVNKYGRAFSHSSFSSFLNQSPYESFGRVTLEADVADDNHEYVKDKLYSYGAITVI